MILLIGENIFKDNNINKKIVNGISISPKKNYCILKIWLKDNKYNKKEFLNKFENLDYNNILFKSHIDNIKQDKDKINNNKIYYSGRRQH